MPPVPIVILSFNRAEYLEAVLKSLVGQVGAGVTERPVFLFQDGAVNPFSNLTHGDPASIVRNLELFRQIVPHGTPLAAAHNLGVALNFDRAERFVFEELRSEAAIFLEDDLVLGPHYLTTLERLLSLSIANDRIGYVAAYGRHTASAAEQLLHCSDITLMGHNWGFCLTRRQWLRQKPYVDQYLSILRHADYRQRDHDRIIDLFHSWGLGVPGTSQDIAKSHAVILTGAAKVNTYACFARYIGETGLHFSADAFRTMGFGDTPMMEDDVFRPAPPANAVLDEYLAIARNSAMVEAVAKRGAPPPHSPAELATRVRALAEAGRFPDAAKLCAAGHDEFPDHRDKYGHPIFVKEHMRLALASGDQPEAMRWASVLREQIGPRDPCIHILLGRHYLRAGDHAAASQEALAVLALDPANNEAMQWIASHKPAS